jgi:hypothetical protein
MEFCEGFGVVVSYHERLIWIAHQTKRYGGMDICERLGVVVGVAWTSG